MEGAMGYTKTRSWQNQRYALVFSRSMVYLHRTTVFCVKVSHGDYGVSSSVRVLGPEKLIDLLAFHSILLRPPFHVTTGLSPQGHLLRPSRVHA